MFYLCLYAFYIKQPYLQFLTDTSIKVLWETSEALPGKVQYGFTSDYMFEIYHYDSTIFHEIEIYPLIKDTLYHYRVISGNDTSPDFTFHTIVSNDRDFRFIVFGDTRTDSIAHQSVINRILQTSPEPFFVIQTGDLTQSGSSQEYQTYFNIEKDLISKTVQYPVLGNHDIPNMTNWFKYFSLPNNERWFTFHFGNSAFHFLDNYSPDTIGTEQYNWLLNELLQDSADQDIRHIFIVFHEPPYTTNLGHTSNLRIRENLVPLFERFNVRIVFNGHNHCYERSFVNGLFYIISGGGGAPLYDNWGQFEEWTIYREATYEFVIIDVKGDTIISKGVKPTGEAFDSFTIITSSTGKDEEFQLNELLFEISSNILIKDIIVYLNLPERDYIEISVYNIAGEKMGTLVKSVLDKGMHKFVFTNELLNPGIYYLVLKTSYYNKIKRFVAL